MGRGFRLLYQGVVLSFGVTENQNSSHWDPIPGRLKYSSS